jgi:ferredoxin
MTRQIDETAVIDADEGLEALVRALIRRGRTVVGPTVRDDAIVLAELASARELPYGWGVEAEAGTYRLRRRTDRMAFAHSAGPQSWKQYLHPERVRQWTADRSQGGSFTVTEEVDRPPSYAFLGVRPCDLVAIATQDRVLMGGPHTDDVYQRRRTGTFLVVVECVEPGGTCFCVSMDTGPAVHGSYDLALTEVDDERGHRLWARAGSEAGAEVLAALPRRPADAVTVDMARDAVTRAAGRMGRTMPEVDLRVLMRDTREAERWNDVAARCLTCGNCTMVCPTCYCTTTEDVTDLTGDHAERWRRWDVCYDLDFTHMQGGSVRQTGRSRYRQWLTHKIGTWHDQFDMSGCVGCGRCIVWCPVAIDITEEAHALHAERAADAADAEETPEGGGDL